MVSAAHLGGAFLLGFFAIWLPAVKLVSSYNFLIDYCIKRTAHFLAKFVSIG